MVMLIQLTETFAVCPMEPTAPIPSWSSRSRLYSITRTPDELSIVSPQRDVSEGIPCERGWRCLRVAGTIDFAAIGVLASLLTPLAAAGISVFALSTFATDYLFVKQENWAKAMAALCGAGHTISEASGPPN